MGYKLVKEKGRKFYIIKSKRKNKKYDVYDAKGNYFLSFGDKRYEHYQDKIGDYSHLDHMDKKRRANYRKRSAGIGFLDDTNSPNYWSRKYLW